MNMKLSAKIDSKREPIPCLRSIWIKTGDAARPLACKWLIGELTTSTEFRVKRSDALRLKGDRHGKILHFATDDRRCRAVCLDKDDRH
jgi:hypothetical protein